MTASLLLVLRISQRPQERPRNLVAQWWPRMLFSHRSVPRAWPCLNRQEPQASQQPILLECQSLSYLPSPTQLLLERTSTLSSPYSSSNSQNTRNRTSTLPESLTLVTTSQSSPPRSLPTRSATST